MARIVRLSPEFAVAGQLTAADLANAAMAADHHGSEAITLPEIRLRTQYRKALFVLA